MRQYIRATDRVTVYRLASGRIDWALTIRRLPLGVIVSAVSLADLAGSRLHRRGFQLALGRTCGTSWQTPAGRWQTLQRTGRGLYVVTLTRPPRPSQ